MNGDDEQQNGRIFKGRILSYRQKWAVGITTPIVVLMISWAGSWVSSMITQGAVQDTRLSVIETRLSTLEYQRIEVLNAVREVADNVKILTEKIDNLPFTPRPTDLPQRIARIERKLDQMTTKERHVVPIIPIPDSVQACKEDEYQVRAANGEYFCRRR